MTTEQTARCDALARRIAELDPDWLRAGMCCRDPDGGGHWRLAGGGSVTWDDDAAWPGGPCGKQAADSLGRARATGPDWRDDATLGAILLGLGDNMQIAADFDDESGAVEWTVWVEEVPAVGHTRAEAILAAKVAALEAK